MIFTKNNRKGQTWSFDLIVAVVLFVVVVSIFYAFLTSDKNVDKTEFLENGAQAITAELNCDLTANNSLCVVQKGVLNTSLLDDLHGKSYDQLRAELGVPGDFCIYIRDRDGNVVPLELSDTVTGVGNSDLKLYEDGGVQRYCGDIIS